jgi:hypothetical protein
MSFSSSFSAELGDVKINWYACTNGQIVSGENGEKRKLTLTRMAL